MAYFPKNYYIYSSFSGDHTAIPEQIIPDPEDPFTYWWQYFYPSASIDSLKDDNQNLTGYWQAYPNLYRQTIPPTLVESNGSLKVSIGGGTLYPDQLGTTVNLGSFPLDTFNVNNSYRAVVKPRQGNLALNRSDGDFNGFSSGYAQSIFYKNKKLNNNAEDVLWILANAFNISEIAYIVDSYVFIEAGSIYETFPINQFSAYAYENNFAFYTENLPITDDAVRVFTLSGAIVPRATGGTSFTADSYTLGSEIVFKGQENIYEIKQELLSANGSLINFLTSTDAEFLGGSVQFVSTYNIFNKSYFQYEMENFANHSGSLLSEYNRQEIIEQIDEISSKKIKVNFKNLASSSSSFTRQSPNMAFLPSSGLDGVEIFEYERMGGTAPIPPLRQKQRDDSFNTPRVKNGTSSSVQSSLRTSRGSNTYL